jgi:hypothetical protein
MLVWCCVENCAAESEGEKDVFVGVQFVLVEECEDDFCSIQNTPSAIVSSQESIVLAHFTNSFPAFSGKTFYNQVFTALINQSPTDNFSPPPFEILRQLRI